QRVQARQTLGDFRHARLLRRIEQCAAAHEIEMMPLQQPALVWREPERVALAPQRVDPREQARIEHDLDAMRRELWRVIAVDRVARKFGRRFSRNAAVPSLASSLL